MAKCNSALVKHKRTHAMVFQHRVFVLCLVGKAKQKHYFKLFAYCFQNELKKIKNCSDNYLIFNQQVLTQKTFFLANKYSNAFSDRSIRKIGLKWLAFRQKVTFLKITANFQWHAPFAHFNNNKTITQQPTDWKRQAARNKNFQKRASY